MKKNFKATPDRGRRYDVIGVGFGPANIALAVAFEELHANVANVVFLEGRKSSAWQPGMLFAGADIQNHPLRDLVTPRNPRSKYSFVNFLFETNRLFEHLNLGIPFPLRSEYAQYIDWVADHFARWVRYSNTVSRIEVRRDLDGHGDGYRVYTETGQVFEADALVVAPGRTPFIPSVFAESKTPRIIHANEFLPALDGFDRAGLKHVAVVGGSQSAVEIMLYLAKSRPDLEITGITRSFGYRLKDTSPFTGEVYFPEFVDLFYNASESQKERLISDLHYTNYSSSDKDVLDELYKSIYEQKILGRSMITLYRSTDIVSVDILSHRPRL
ncbi:MAG: SidA/IucD/PvdA family monooxygenase, partial [Geminicoccaceae bacterium]